MWAIIGGSGFEQFEEVVSVESLSTETPFGEASSGLRKIKIQDTECIFLSRHGAKHERLPSEINYRANIFALKKLGVTRILALSAVGSLRKELSPGDLVLPSQYVDQTKGIRKSSFCGEGLVGHISLAKPVWSKGIEWIDSIAHELEFKTHTNKTYVCIEGPYFSTQAESHYYRMLGADIIGMTNFPEYALAREAGISYLPCCFVTDYDSWDTTVEHVTLEGVLNVMKQNNKNAFKLILKILHGSLEEDTGIREMGLKTGVMSTVALSNIQKDFLNLLVN